jgi:hypothetical protein
MFGFLNPVTHTGTYRQVYARCCQHHQLHYGLRSLPFLSYESIFLFLCWLDSSGASPSVLPQQRCCRLRQGGIDSRSLDFAIGQFCAAANLLLARMKLDDDVRDEESLMARGAARVLAGDFRRAQRYFVDMDPHFDATVRRAVEAHLAVEARADRVSLDEYVQPTADAFGYLFRLLARVPGMQVDGARLSALGRCIASAVIAFDCYVDWRRDQQRGSFNPLRSRDDREAAGAYADACLCAGHRMCQDMFGTYSLGAETLLAVRARVARRLQRSRVVSSHCAFGPAIADAMPLLLAPLTSHVDSSYCSERRDKFGLCCAMLAGACVQGTFEAIKRTSKRG